MNVAAHPAQCSLSVLGRRIVDVARLDGRRGVPAAEWLERFGRALFGLLTVSRLINYRLEALRRFCMSTWYWNLIRIVDVQPAIAVGYAIADLLKMLAHVAHRQGDSPAILEHQHPDRDWSAVSPRSAISSPALPAPRPSLAARAELPNAEAS